MTDMTEPSKTSDPIARSTTFASEDDYQVRLSLTLRDRRAILRMVDAGPEGGFVFMEPSLESLRELRDWLSKNLPHAE